MNRPCLLAPFVVIACSGAPSPPGTLAPPELDLVPTLRGVPDHAYDPAVVLLALDGRPFCTAGLLEQDVVVTARRCLQDVVGDGTCPASGTQLGAALDPARLHVLVGDDVLSAVDRSPGREVILPPRDTLCGADLGFLLLSEPVADITPLVVSATGAAQGDHVRTVEFSLERKLVRDHVPVSQASPSEIGLAQAPCVGLPGGAVIDPTSGDLLGVVARGGPSCDAPGAGEVATRTDAFFPLVTQVLAMGTMSHASHKAKPKKGPIDQGASCAEASDCAAGACVAYDGEQYCSRTCGPTDRCPSTTRCMASAQSTEVCVAE
jgi:hypothetical protein